MWIVMMVAMMLPSLVPMLWRYCGAVTCAAGTRLGPLTTIVGMGYFAMWTVGGMVAIPLGLALAQAEMQHPALSRAVPIAAGMIVVIAGASQFTAWKAHHLACCRELSAFARRYPRELRRDLAVGAVGRGGGPERGRTVPADAGTAWRHGMRLGLHCSCCSAGLTAILLVMGVMDLRVMAAVTTAVTAERLAPAGERVARAIGVIVICAGVLLLARAVSVR
jgi:predicted metal-binding membrane protein